MVIPKLIPSFIGTVLCLIAGQAKSVAQRLPRPEIPKKSPPPLPIQPRAPKIEIEPAPAEVLGPEGWLPTLVVKQFRFKGNRVIPTADLQAVVEPYLGRPLTMNDLVGVKNAITELYVKRGYINSGAIISLVDNQSIALQSAVLTIRIVEGRLERITVRGSQRLKRYVQKRLGVNTRKVFNLHDLEKGLRLLQDDPLVSDIEAKVQGGSALNSSELFVQVEAASPYQVEGFVDNYRNQGVGALERGVDFTALNPTERGDKLSLYFSNTEGSNALEATYSVPLTLQGTMASFSYSYGQNATIQAPFNPLDIQGTSQIYNLQIQHPVFRLATETLRSELLVGMSMQRLESQGSLLGDPFPITRGADAKGRIRTTVLSLYQAWLHRDSKQAASIRSQLNWGLDIGAATDPLFNDGQFFSWQGDASWTHELPEDLLFVSHVQLQLANRPLVATEQFALGGFSTVRGYEQDAVLGDNGVLGSIELQVPVYSGRAGTFTLSPFVDAGRVWDDPELEGLAATLASVGLSLQYDLNERLSANLTWGMPLLDVSSEEKTTLQEQSVTFSLRWRLY